MISLKMIKETNYGVFDFETSEIKAGLQKFVIGAIYYDGFFVISEDINQIIDSMIQSKKKIFYAHNMMYDFRFMLKSLREKKLNFNCILSGSDLISVKVFYKDDFLFELRDSYSIFRCSLERISNDINIEYKKKKYANICNSENELKYNRIEFINYLKLDCLSLFESIQKMYDFLGYDVKKDKLSLSIAGIGMKEWKKRNKNLDYKQDFAYDDVFRKTYFGGRTEVFTKEFLNYDKILYYYDFNSLYPYVMKKNAFPHGKIIDIKDEKEFNRLLCENIDFIALINVKIPNQYYTNCPYRHEGKLFFIAGELKESWFNSVEIRSFIENGYKVEFLKGFYFTKKSYYFHSYVDYFYSLRQKNKGTAKDKISKLLLNSLYGKFAQRNEFDRIEYIEKEDLVFRLVECEHKGEKITPLSDNYYSIKSRQDKEFSTSYISSFITSYARLELFNLFKSIKQKNGNIFYADTDSVFADIKIESDKHILGALKLESEVEKALFILPKFYMYVEKNYPNKFHVKIKGIQRHLLKEEQILDLYFNGKDIIESRVLVSKIKKISRGYLDALECININKIISLDNITEKRKFFLDTSRSININELIDINPKFAKFDNIKIKFDDKFDILAESDSSLNLSEKRQELIKKLNPSFRDINK